MSKKIVTKNWANLFLFIAGVALLVVSLLLLFINQGAESLSAAIMLMIMGLLLIMISVSLGQPRPIDYRNLFVMGLVWMIIGFPLNNQALWALGIILTVVGLLNTKKWGQSAKIKLTPQEQRAKTGVLIITTICLVAGMFIYFVTQAR